MSKIGYRIKSTANKAVSIYINFRPPNSEPLEIRTGLSVNPSSWSKQRQRAKSRDGILQELNYTLNKLGSFVEICINDANGENLDKKWFNKTVDSYFNRLEKKDPLYLLNFYADFLIRISDNKGGSVGLKTNTVKVYRSFYKILVDYENDIESPMRFDRLDKDAFDDLYSWLLSKRGYSPGHINRQITRLKTLCRAASSSGVKVNSYHIVHKAKPIHSQKYLTIINEKEIELIKNYIPANSYLENARKWMLIGLHIGQRVSDLLSLTPANMRLNKPGVVLVDVTQKKTGISLTIPIKDPVVFDIITNQFPHRIADQNFNKYLKKLCEACGVDSETTGYLMGDSGRNELKTAPKWTFISSHDLRRSFATNHFYKGIPVPLLMQITGHRRESTFFDYIGHKFTKDQHAKAFLEYL
jgi:integrase|tara:strand:- start:3781 stop:5019 length:1239 start_codon:yes stop_codon:yes gene_type:complete